VNWTNSTGLSQTATPGVDYIVNGGLITFPVGNTNQTFITKIVSDSLNEADEILYVKLFNQSPSTVSIAGDTKSITIVDDDATPQSSSTLHYQF